MNMNLIKTTIGLILVSATLSGCTAIIDHFDPKAQAWKSCINHHADKHPDCGRSTFCKRLGHEIGPGTVLP